MEKNISDNDVNSKTLNGIHCDVCNCKYNNNNSCCTAKQISVGPNYAISSSDTICSTFKPTN